MSESTDKSEQISLTRMRRDLHRIPELDFNLPRTIAYIRNELEAIRDRTNAAYGHESCSIIEPSQSTICVIFNKNSPNTTAVRSDMDALPVTERTNSEFASQHRGCMHACGHDGHMAMVLGLAHHLAESFGELPRNVLLVFQPAEETTGGARLICESGIFEQYGVDRIFGFHLWPDLPKGVIASRPGGLLAAASESTFRFNGRSAHIAKAQDGADALEAGARFLLEAYDYMEEKRREEPCLLKCGVMRSGDVRNVISSHTVIEGSLRTFSHRMGAQAKKGLARIAQDCAEATGCTADVHFADGYPPVVNDDALFARAAETLPELQCLPDPLLIGEDFAFYQQHIPGVFFLLGTGTGIPLHADTFDFDETILSAGLDAYKRLVRMV